MENTEQNKPSNLLDPQSAKAWIFTLALGIAVCLGLIVYTLITHNPPINLESSLYKPKLVWVGFIGWIICFINYFLLWISTSLLKHVPDNKHWINLTASLGIFSLLLTFILLSISYDIEHKWLSYISYNLQIAGLNMIFTQELIQHKFPKIANFWNFIGAITILVAMTLLLCTLDT